MRLIDADELLLELELSVKNYICRHFAWMRMENNRYKVIKQI